MTHDAGQHITFNIMITIGRTCRWCDSSGHRDSSGSRHNVEVQLRKGAVDSVKRSLYYTTKLYSEQLMSGHDYDLLQKAVSISILDFNLFPDSTELHSKFLLWDRERDFKFTDDLELHYMNS